MAIDTSMFGVDIPAGTYAAGDILTLKSVDGPANVRSGRGNAVLKNIFAATLTQNSTYWRIHVKNSDWVDEVASIVTAINVTSFDDMSGASQSGHDAPLTENSGWQLYAECIVGGTETAANSLFTLIDIDYPSVSSIVDPQTVKGIPATIGYSKVVAAAATGSIETATWTVESVDYFKAGSTYALDAVELGTTSGGAIHAAFVAFSNAAGMGGLQRIIPLHFRTDGIRYPIKYSSQLVKGPMDIKLKAFAASAGNKTLTMCHDYVKRI